MFGETGFDRYLEWQMGYGTDFTNALFSTIALADAVNLARLERGFPEHVHAHIAWRDFGREVMLARVTPGHPLLKAAP